MRKIYDIFDDQSLFSKIDIADAKKNAFEILRQRNNFIHSIDHAIRVHDNAVYISRQLDQDLNVEEMIALKLACFWHDTGKDDWSEKEDVPHNIVSGKLFESYARAKGMPEDILLMTQSIIYCHRNRGKASFRDPLSVVEKILWDADKLDIINADRVVEILWLYVNGYTNGEFNPEDTLTFWRGIPRQFSDNYYFETSRNLFKERYPEFINVVEQQYQAYSRSQNVLGT